MTFKDIHQISYEELRELDKILIEFNKKTLVDSKFKLLWILRMLTKESPCVVSAGFDTFPILEDILDLKYHHSHISSELLEKCAKHHATVIVNADFPFEKDVEFYDGEKYIFISDRHQFELDSGLKVDCIIHIDSQLVYIDGEVRYYVHVPTTHM